MAGSAVLATAATSDWIVRPANGSMILEALGAGAAGALLSPCGAEKLCVWPDIDPATVKEAAVLLVVVVAVLFVTLGPWKSVQSRLLRCTLPDCTSAGAGGMANGAASGAAAAGAGGMSAGEMTRAGGAPSARASKGSYAGCDAAAAAPCVCGAGADTSSSNPSKSVVDACGVRAPELLPLPGMFIDSTLPVVRMPLWCALCCGAPAAAAAAAAAASASARTSAAPSCAYGCVM